MITNSGEIKKKSLGYATKKMMENIVQKFSGRGGLVYTVPTENDMDNKILQLLELPEGRRDPVAVQDIKDDLVITQFHVKRQEQLKKLQVSELKMNSSANKVRIKVENLVDLETSHDTKMIKKNCNSIYI